VEGVATAAASGEGGGEDQLQQQQEQNITEAEAEQAYTVGEGGEDEEGRDDSPVVEVKELPYIYWYVCALIGVSVCVRMCGKMQRPKARPPIINVAPCDRLGPCIYL
jgi:hypothetical protein